MVKIERFREVLTGVVNLSSLEERLKQGWTIAALEWERFAAGEEGGDETWKEEVPYGLRVASDCRHLEENPAEKRVLEAMLQLIAADKPMSKVAETLNREGFRTRDGQPWTQTAAFDMLPRLIEAAPRLRRVGAG